MTRAAFGIGLQIAVWLFVIFSVFEAYDRYEQAVEVQGKTRQLSGELYGSIYSTVLFVGSLSLIGLALMMEVAIRAKYRERWFFWVSLVLAVPACIIFPIGTLFGAGYIIYLFIKWKEFHFPNNFTQC